MKNQIVGIEADAGSVVVDWQDGHRSRFHNVWLRHADFFPVVANGDTSPRNLHKLSSDLAEIRVDAKRAPNGKLCITWPPDGHETQYDPDWLRGHCYSASERARRRRLPKLWDNGLSVNLPAVSYPDLHDNETALMALYDQILDFGFCFVRDTPAQPGRIIDLGTLLGLVRLSAYGDEKIDRRIENLQTNSNIRVATRQSHYLGPHTDTCWRTSLTGLVCFHCLVADDEGGETLLVDGFRVSDALRAADPDAYRLLSEISFDFSSSVNNGDEWRARGRVITCDSDDNVIGFRYNDHSFTPLDLPEVAVEPAYAALARLADIINDPTYQIRLKLAPGDALIIDNQRVLHGRSAFDGNQGRRHLQYCAVERDTFHNCYRHVARRLGYANWDETLALGAC